MVWVLASLAGAAEYHVSQSGSDTHPGTAEKPWRTLQKASATVRPGDTVYIGAGQWTENVTRMKPGVEGNPIVWIGQGMDDTLCGRFVPASHTQIRNLHVTWQIETVGNAVVMEGVRFSWTGGRQAWVKTTGWHPGGPYGVIIRNCEFLGCGKTAAVTLNSVDSLIENCFFTTSNGGDAIYLNGRRNTVRGCTFKDWNKPAGSTQHTDLFQSWSSNGEVSMDHLIENNFAIDCIGAQLGNVEDQNGKNEVRGWTWRNNIFVRVSNPLNLYAQDFVFHNNTFFQTPTAAGSCVLVRSAAKGAGHNTQFFNNIFYQGGHTPTRIDLGYYGFSRIDLPVTGFEADYNLVIGVGAGTVKGGPWWDFNANTNSLNGVDPVFVNGIDPTQPGDLALRSDSPAIGAGKNLGGEADTDFTGASRGSRWDIGAFQYQAPEPEPEPEAAPSRSRRFRTGS